MTCIEESIEIAASPSAVFKLCHDIARRPEWDARVVRVELLTPAPLRRGSLVRIEAGSKGKFLFSWDAEYADYRFPGGSTLKVLDAAPSSPFKSGTETWRVDKSPDGTRFVLLWEYTPRGIIARLRDSLGRRAATGRAIRHSLSNLKALAEKQ
jgi:hypothetical protein